MPPLPLTAGTLEESYEEPSIYFRLNLENFSFIYKEIKSDLNRFEINSEKNESKLSILNLLSNWPIRRPLILEGALGRGARLMCNLDRLHWMEKKVGSLSKKQRQPQY